MAHLLEHLRRPIAGRGVPPTQAVESSIVVTSIGAQIPPEILFIVFSLLDFDDRLRASHTCSSWCFAAQAYPQLWASIVTKGRRRGAFAYWLERARHVPLTIALSCRSYRCFFQESLQHLVQHMPRVKVLAIAVDKGIHKGNCGQYNAAALTQFLCSARALALESFTLVVRAGSIALPEELFALNAPHLRSLGLQGGISIPRVCPAVALVSTLSISLKFSDDQAPETIDHLRIFSSLAHLRTDDLSAQTLPSGGPGTPLHLQSLWFIGRCLGPWLSEHAHLNRVPSLWMSHYPGIFGDIMPPHGSQCARIAVYPSGSKSRIDVQALLHDGRYLSVTNDPLRHRLNSNQFTSVEQLTIPSDWIIFAGTSEVELPCLRTLTIALVSVGDSPPLNSSLFSGVGERRVLNCPLLNTLVIATQLSRYGRSATTSAVRCTISYGHVFPLITRTLQFTTEKLSVLKLRGVELDPSSAEDRLHTLVDDIQTDKNPLPWHWMDGAHRPNDVWDMPHLPWPTF
ncbi:hypothetical protein EXIGLDRAFT_724609 [Exidia glandulosa HHB12029]|uniref:F-box domain-containing protein n=1 Tax=Exidia glandulosa HHB12029 TaxID=1314781 RepID=A0A165MQ16_EXIGL|nr:hypothetical protein EXIGLDRAFT_724609 [Exidia glandulosa HHB12029]